MNKDPKIYVAGHRGMAWSAIVGQLQARGLSNIVTRTHAELDLSNQQAVTNFFKEEKPEQVYLSAAKVGGIHANNTYPAEFIYQNLMMEANVIHQAFESDVKKLLFLGSSCIYPKMASWLSLQKQELRNSDQHDDFIMKERRVYQSLLDSYMKLRKSQDEHLMFLHRLKIKPDVVVLEDFDRNEITESDAETMT